MVTVTQHRKWTWDLSLVKLGHIGKSHIENAISHRAQGSCHIQQVNSTHNRIKKWIDNTFRGWVYKIHKTIFEPASYFRKYIVQKPSGQFFYQEKDGILVFWNGLVKLNQNIKININV